MNFQMNFSIIAALVFFLCFVKKGTSKTNVPKPNNIVDKDGALFLSNLIENGQVGKAKELSVVKHPQIGKLTSYAGLITVNKIYQSNLYFWFFPSQNNPVKDPVLLWLYGGPAASNFYAIFTENGPLIVNTDKTVEIRNTSFTTNHSVIYVDSPVGTGFSFTKNQAAYPRTLKETANQLLIFLEQFFVLYPEFHKNDFFIGGDSYGSRFAIALGKAIMDQSLDHKRNTKIEIKFKGIAVASMLIADSRDGNKADYFYSIGALDMKQRNRVVAVENRVFDMYEQSIYSPNDFRIMNQTSQLFFENLESTKKLVGYDSVSSMLETRNFLDTTVYDFIDYVQRPDVRKALHAGKLSYNVSSNIANGYLPRYPFGNVKLELEQVLKNYNVLIFVGQWDGFTPYISIVNMILRLQWPGASDYLEANRKIWKVNGTLAGYWKKARNLNEVLIRNAGHIPTADQLPWVVDMLNKFTRGQTP